MNLDLVYLHFAHFHGKTRPRAAAGYVCGDDEFSDGRESPILRAIEIGDGRAHTKEFTYDVYNTVKRIHNNLDQAAVVADAAKTVAGLARS